MNTKLKVVAVAGPTASGKSAKALEIAHERNGEIISVDSRQVYRMLDIGTEKITPEEMEGIPHHLIDIRDPKESYSAGDFAQDATKLIEDITARGKLPILAGGSHFYFHALIYGIPAHVAMDPVLRAELETYTDQELYERVQAQDAHRAESLDPNNRRRLIRALEILQKYEKVPEPIVEPVFDVEWIVLNPEREVLRERISARLEETLAKGLIQEVEKVREYVGDDRLNELGLEYKVIGEFLRGERTEDTLLPTLTSRLYHYARRQKAWLRKLELN
ncbi:tRNA (adenosine(37)-N6)-dimethylallyltransferase MiaA [Patescibacteria group bacterium]|nr:tRNA (adenosine(37)-N6)-dimethylallyltransferase MiaA [Patescibacteria group bacterium]MBU1755171.1 tRNA (adenosine(37)-N6)-dimethylallyltransferase MiaA [Patescibacteria group bacterium]